MKFLNMMSISQLIILLLNETLDSIGANATLRNLTSILFTNFMRN
jgi:hypothetical protein